jgi:hypothetical protein
MMGEGTGGGSRGVGLRIFLVFLGAVVLTAGAWVLADNYALDFECGTEITCHPEDAQEPATIDRIVTALGFGIEPSTSNGDTLPGPGGTLLVVAGLALLLAAALMGSGDRRAAPVVAAAPQPMSPEFQLERYERLRERGVLTDDEFEQRKARLVPSDRAPY